MMRQLQILKWLDQFWQISFLWNDVSAAAASVWLLLFHSLPLICVFQNCAASVYDHNQLEIQRPTVSLLSSDSCGSRARGLCIYLQIHLSCWQHKSFHARNYVNPVTHIYAEISNIQSCKHIYLLHTLKINNKTNERIRDISGVYYAANSKNMFTNKLETQGIKPPSFS